MKRLDLKENIEMTKFKPTEKEKQMTKSKTLFLVMTAVFTAFTFVATMFLNIPAAAILGAGGNINLGDSIIFIAAIILGPVGGAIVGGLGATLADIASAYILYAPFTLIIKSVLGFLCGFLFRYVFKNRGKFLKYFLSMLIASTVVVVGYFFAEIILQAIAGTESAAVIWIMGARTIIPSLIQVGVSLAIAMVAVPKLPQLMFE